MAAALAVSLSACASDRDSNTTTSADPAASDVPSSDAPEGTDGGSAEPSSGGTEGGGASDATFTFGAAGAPSMFDPLYATDGETFRVTRQMTEGLVAFKPGTADAEPALAESWESDDTGTEWTFKIREGVTFHDGTALDAEAVCFNFDRMYNQTEAGATQAQYWSDTMGGFAGTDVPSLYESCTADGTNAVIKLTGATSKFPSILGLPSFSIQSPAALEEFKANEVKAVGDSFEYPAYATENPTGTGPFKFSKYDKANNTVELVRNDDYWGEKAKVAKVIFKIIPDETARKQELQAGTIDGYDLPNPADWADLEAEGFNVEVRPAFNVMYLGITQNTNEKLKDLRVRQAIAYALNRDQFVASQLPEGAETAVLYYPNTVEGWTDDVTQYPYDVEKAKSLLAEAGAEGLALNFWWPTEVSRPYMPDPKAVFTSMKADLEAAGFVVNETSKPWNGGYLDGVDAQQADLFLLGWTGDYNTPDNFIGTFFSDPTSRFATENAPWGTELSESLKAADAEPDEATRAEMYVEINKKLLGEYLPAVPISHSPPAIVVAGNVEGLIASPLTDERFVSVSVS